MYIYRQNHAHAKRIALIQLKCCNKDKVDDTMKYIVYMSEVRNKLADQDRFLYPSLYTLFRSQTLPVLSSRGRTHLHFCAFKEQKMTLGKW